LVGPPPPEPCIKPDTRERGPGGEGAEGALGGISDERPVAQCLAGAVLGQSQGWHHHQGCRCHGDPGDWLSGVGLADEDTIELMAKDTAALTDALSLERANVLGISMGGRIAAARDLRELGATVTTVV
jgi:pimeloyl-ACP methyl ester carboxylesterase